MLLIKTRAMLEHDLNQTRKTRPDSKSEANSLKFIYRNYNPLSCWKNFPSKKILFCCNNVWICCGWSEEHW